MGKAPAKRLRPNIAHIKTKAARRQHSQAARSKLPSSASTGRGPLAKTNKKNDRVHDGNTGQSRVPFNNHDRVLLIGEGDFSFALSLVKHHKPLAVTATCYDSWGELVEKYPNVMTTVEQLDTTAAKITTGAKVGDSEATNNEDNLSEEEDQVFEGFSPPPTTAQTKSNYTTSSAPQPAPASRHRPSSAPQTHSRVLYSIDATQLARHRKALLNHHQRPEAPAFTPFTKIVFNFPHVGGLSTDINRQVRANQELLVKFLEACKALLVPLESGGTMNEKMRLSKHANREIEGYGNGIDKDSKNNNNNNERYATPSDSGSDSEDSISSTPDGQLLTGTTPQIPQVLITIFEGHPYTLWNVRDLARHTGYSIVESFRFPWSAYPGYAHARTLGDIVPKGVDGRHVARSGGEEPAVDGEQESRNMETDKGKGKGKKGRWHGEDRDARTYVLELREHQEQVGSRGVNVNSGKRKRGRGDDGSEDDD
jgi:25S rRNA (uracil2634-N3)-methyltransferase